MTTRKSPGVTQGAVSYLVIRGMERIRWLIATDYLSFDADEMYADLLAYFATVRDGAGRLMRTADKRAAIFVAMFRATCQVRVAQQIGIRQPEVRTYYLGGIRMLAVSQDPRLQRYAALFRALKEAGAILHHQDQPWRKRARAQ